MSTKAKAVLGLATLKPDEKVTKAQSIIDAMQNSGFFPDAGIPISYSTLQSYIDALHKAIIDAYKGPSTNVSYMHELEKKLLMAFNLVKSHVEFISNQATDAETYILSAGMGLAGNSGQSSVTALTLVAKGNGVIMIRVPRGMNEGAFLFEYSLEEKPTIWQTAGYSTLTKFHLKNLIPATKVWIRYAGINKIGLTVFSDAKQIIVL